MALIIPIILMLKGVELLFSVNNHILLGSTGVGFVGAPGSHVKGPSAGTIIHELVIILVFGMQTEMKERG